MSQVSKTFHQSGHDVPALVGVSLNLFDGETLGLVGESGSGKSTLAKTILGIESPDPGSSLEFDDHALAAQSSGRPTADKRALQMVFQNPDSALNRGWTARAILSRSVSKLTGLKGKEVNERVDKLAVGSAPDPAPPGPQAAAAVGRAQAARGDRPGIRGRPPDRRGRRADERARRIGPGGDPQPAVRAPAQEQDELPADLARSRGRPLPRRPDRGDVPRPHHGGRGVGEGLQRTEPSLHRGVALGGPVRGRGGTRPDPARRARSRVRPTHPRAASSTPAATA